MKKISFLFSILTLLFLFSINSFAQSDTTIKVLIVTAHPDDDALFSATVYKITHNLGGKVDLCLITNGEGGYKYSTLGEPIYGLELTDEAVGREYLPDIRKKELKAGCAIVGIKDFFFLDQKDHRYTTDVHEIMDSTVWDIPFVKRRLKEIIEAGKYNYIFCLLPVPTTHAHHASSAILTLQVVNEMPLSTRPVVLGGTMSSKGDTTKFTFTGLEKYPVTKISPDPLMFTFDRTAPFGFQDRLNYKIIANWVIAEHKSQGTMQLLMNMGDIEEYIWYDLNDKNKIEQTKQLFDKLAINYFKKKDYDLTK
ncbi:MAG: PIG-L family deacetylase [Bacteroidetes bacterium]|nr:PIG-L family deacetylase [Bacteroidota bacterium]